MGKNFPRTKQNTKSSFVRFWWTELGPLEESRSSLLSALQDARFSVRKKVWDESREALPGEWN